MKRLVLYGAVLSAITFSSINLGLGQAPPPASVEDGKKPCWTCIKTKNGSQVRYCGTCDWVDNATDCIFTLESEC